MLYWPNTLGVCFNFGLVLINFVGMGGVGYGVPLVVGSEIDMLPFVRLAGTAAQTRLVNEVVFTLLGDSDHRVRQSASSALVR